MPDHVHIVFMPYEVTPLRLLGEIKGGSSFEVNRRTRRRGSLWQRDAFDRIVRSDEKLHAKRDYIFNNPVRAGIVERWQDYQWIWWSGGL